MKKNYKSVFRTKLFVRSYLITMFSFFIAILIFMGAIGNYLSHQVRKTQSSYNLSAVKGIGTYVEIQKNDMMDLIDSAYKNSLSSKKNVFRFLEYSEEEIKENDYIVAQDRQYMINFISNIFHNNDSVSALLVYSPGTNQVYNIFGLMRASYDGDNDIFSPLRNIYEKGDISRKLTIIPSEIENEQSQAPSYALLYPINSLITFEAIGSIEMDFSTLQIDKFLKQYYPGVISDFMMLNANNEVIYSSIDKLYNAEKLSVDQIVEASLKKNTITLDDIEYYVNYCTIDKLNITVIGLLSKDEVFSGIRPVFTMVILITASIWFLVGVLTYLITNSSSLKLKKIQNSMKLTQQGNLQAYIEPDLKNQDELYDITIAFNHMLHDLNEYINKVYASELERKEYLMMALQAQINPHFLYNSFEAIRMKAVIEDEQEIADMVFILSKIFRNTSKGSGVLSIETEVENCINYLRLHEMRYKEQLHYNINVDEDIYQYIIVQYALQVSIENYIFHGFDNNRYDNHIQITGKKDGDDILFTIEDNGIGMSEEELFIQGNLLEEYDIKQRKSIGLPNVYKRLQVVFGDSTSMKVEANKPNGIRVIMRFRAMTEEI